MPRPRIHPALRQVWRDPSTLQLGVCPPHGIVLRGFRPGDAHVITTLDGMHDLPAVYRLAAAHGVSRERVAQILRTLADAGALIGWSDSTAADSSGPARATDRADLAALGSQARDRLGGDADTWSLTYGSQDDGLWLLAQRAARRVLVDGTGPLGQAIAGTLRDAGVGAVDLRDGGEGDHRDGGESDEPPDLLVVVRYDAIDVRVADELARQGAAHLAVVQSVDRVVVGPLVTPGNGPCLRCLDLHRSDRDPAWSAIAAQLAAQPARRCGETATTTAAAGLAALQVLVHLDGMLVPATAGRTLELVVPDGYVQRRRWACHPRCHCAATTIRALLHEEAS